MGQIYPSRDIRKRLLAASSTANAILSSTVSISAGKFGVVYKFWLDLDVTDDTDILALVDPLGVTVSIGSTVWSTNYHPYILRAATDTTDVDPIDLGPWQTDFWPDGLYSGVAGDNITIAVAAAGTGIITRVHAIYAGD